jgi:hypothetical protein
MSPNKPVLLTGAARPRHSAMAFGTWLRRAEVGRVGRPGYVPVQRERVG